MKILLACVAGFILDMFFGDPVWLYHPVRMIGKLIEILERGLRKIAGKSDRALLIAGGLLWLLVTGITVGIVSLLRYLAGTVHPFLAFGLEVCWCYQLLAAKSLKQESMKVYQKLNEADLTGARAAVAMIVGRDTETLDATGITKATVETIAENTSDGVIAPLIYMLIGGAPLAFFYKAVNTMDSMVGYKNDTYLYLGRAAALLDDVFNFIPARISALLMIAAAFLTRQNGKGAWRIYRRDSHNHASPNAAQTEAVCAGALDIQLAGDACYFGKLYKKQTIGDAIRPIEKEDIIRTNQLMYMTAFLMLVIGAGIRLAVGGIL